MIVVIYYIIASKSENKTKKLLPMSKSSALTLVFTILFILLFNLSAHADRVPLRVLTFNVGNMDLSCHKFGFKLCHKDVADRIRNYIDRYNPDVVLLTEMLNSTQLLSHAVGDGRLLDISKYDGICGVSVDRHTGKVVESDAVCCDVRVVHIYTLPFETYELTHLFRTRQILAPFLR